MQEGMRREIRNLSILLKEALEKRGVRVKEVYLFGSYARGDYLKSSDIDLVVVSDDWENIPFLKRFDIVNEAIWTERLGNVEVIPATTKEVNEKNSVILRDAARYWVRIL